MDGRFSLKDQLCTTMNISRMSHKYIREGGAGAPLPEAERRAAEERSTILHQDIDAKRMTIKNLKGALDRLDITEYVLNLRCKFFTIFIMYKWLECTYLYVEWKAYVDFKHIQSSSFKQ